MTSTGEPPAQTPPFKRDIVFLRDLALSIPVGQDAWHRPGKAQPVSLSLRISYDITRSAASDDVSQTLDYGKLSKSITSVTTGRAEPVSGLQELSSVLINEVLDTLTGVTAIGGSGQVDVNILLPKAILRVHGGLRFKERVLWRASGLSAYHVSQRQAILSIQALDCACIIGVNPHERREKQTVVLELTFEGAGAERALQCYQEATVMVIERVEGSDFLTVEALATFVARTLTMDFEIDAVTVSVEKPSALGNVEGAGVEITRSRTFFSKSKFWYVEGDKIET